MLLHIDPDPATRLLVRKTLAAASITVLEAPDLETGARLAQQSLPEVVLVDVDGSDAEMVVCALRAFPGQDRPVLLASTSDQRPDHLALTAQAGFHGVLTKPLDIDTLTHEISCRHPRSEETVSASGLEASPDRARTKDPVHPLWRPVLAPIVASMVRNAATAYGCLALHDEADDTLVVVATHTARPADDVPAVGTRVPTRDLDWVKPALQTRETVLLTGKELGGAALVPPFSTIVAAAPVTGGRRVYGVSILGERRQRPFGLPEAQVAQCVAEAARIGSVLQAVEQRNDAVRHLRLDLDRTRLAGARTIALGISADPVALDPDAASRVRLGLALADRLRLPPAERVVLEQALETVDLGHRWLERIVPPLVTPPATGAHGLLDADVAETCAFIRELGWPEAVAELLESSRGVGPGTDDAPLATRILAAVVAYHDHVYAAGPSPSPDDRRRAAAELRQQSSRVDIVLNTLDALIADHT